MIGTHYKLNYETLTIKLFWFCCSYNKYLSTIEPYHTYVYNAKKIFVFAFVDKIHRLIYNNSIPQTIQKHIFVITK